MNWKPIFGLSASLTLAVIPSCKKEEVAKTKQETATVAEVAETKVEGAVGQVEAATDKAVESVAATEVAVVEAFIPKVKGAIALSEKIGFGAELPKNTEGFLTVLKFAEFFEDVKDMELTKLAFAAAKEKGEDPDEVFKDPEFVRFLKAFGSEAFVAFGEGSGEQLRNLYDLSKLSNYIQARVMVAQGVEELKRQLKPEEGNDPYSGVFGSMGILFKSLNEEREQVLDLWGKVSLPPILAGIHVPDETVRTELMAELTKALQEPLGEDFVEAVTVEKGDGVTFSGFAIKGTFLKQAFEKEVEGEDKKVDEIFGSKENLERVLQALEKKSLNVVAGVKGEHLLIFAGNSLDDLKFALTPADSLASHEELKFAYDYADRDVRLFSFRSTAGFKPIEGETEILASSITGLRDGIAKTDVFGDTRDIQRLLTHLAKLDRGIYDGLKVGYWGAVGFAEKGFKLETFASGNQVTTNLTSQHKISGALAGMEDVFLHAGSVADPNFQKKVLAWINTAGEVIYLAAKRSLELPIKSRDFAQFKQGFMMGEMMAKKPLLDIYQALTEDLGEGLGEESNIVIDLNGSFPDLPPEMVKNDIPGPILKNGRLPRVAYVADVANREKVASAWEKVDATVRQLYKLAGTFQPNVELPPVPVPVAEELDGFTSYSFAEIPYTNANMKPSISVSDDLFMASSSPEMAGKILQRVKSDNKEEVTGAFVTVNFESLYKLAEDYLQLTIENQEEMLSPSERKDLEENEGKVRDFVKALREIQSLKWRSYQEGPILRGSMHFRLEN